MSKNIGIPAIKSGILLLTRIFLKVFQPLTVPKVITVTHTSIFYFAK